MIRRNSNRWLFCLTWSYVKNLVTEVQNDRAKPFQAFFPTATVSSLHISFVSRPWSFWRSAPTALPCEPPLLYRGQWMEEEKNDGSFQSQIPLPAAERERREINLSPITWEILFVAHKEILFDNQNKSSSTALLCSDLVVLQPFQPGNWKRLLKNRSMVNSNYCMVLQLFLFPIQIRN